MWLNCIFNRVSRQLTDISQRSFFFSKKNFQRIYCLCAHSCCPIVKKKIIIIYKLDCPTPLPVLTSARDRDAIFCKFNFHREKNRLFFAAHCKNSFVSFFFFIFVLFAFFLTILSAFALLIPRDTDSARFARVRC